MAANTKKVILFIVEGPTDEQKVDCADLFADTYSDNTNGFVRFLTDLDFTVAGDFRETWRFIFDGTNSLHRHSNLHLLFSDIQG